MIMSPPPRRHLILLCVVLLVLVLPLLLVVFAKGCDPHALPTALREGLTTSDDNKICLTDPKQTQGGRLHCLNAAGIRRVQNLREVASFWNLKERANSISVPPNKRVCFGNVCLQQDNADGLVFAQRSRQTQSPFIARFSRKSGEDRLRVYKNADGQMPFWYWNPDDKTSGYKLLLLDLKVQEAHANGRTGFWKTPEENTLFQHLANPPFANATMQVILGGKAYNITTAVVAPAGDNTNNTNTFWRYYWITDPSSPNTGPPTSALRGSVRVELRAIPK